MKFADDYHVEMIQGTQRLSPGRVRKVMALRAAYLDKKIIERSRAGLNHDFHDEELKAIAQLMECYEATNKP